MYQRSTATALKGLVVGIADAARSLVVAQVVDAAGAVGKAGIEPEGPLAQLVVEPGPAGQQQAVHGVVADDEQPGVKHRADHHGQQQDRQGQMDEISLEQEHQAEHPGQQEGTGQQQALAGGRGRGCGEAQRANLSSSAGDASRSMATK